MFTRRGLLLGVGTVVAVGCATPPAVQQASIAPSYDPASRADAIARKLHADFPTPALSVAVARVDGIVWAQAYGRADIEFDVAATPRHSFKLGSVSKVITATAAARMAARGELDLDAPISRWLPELPEHHRATTLRQLLTHRGGVRHYNGRDLNAAQPGGLPDARTYATTATILALFIDDPLVAEPGSKSIYSTYGYTLASLAMEAAVGQPFLDLVAREVSTPFALGSLQPDDPISLRAGRVSGYGPARDYSRTYPLAKEGWVNVRQVNPAYKWAGGGFVATPSDIARFGAGHLDGGQMSPAMRDLLFTVLVERSPNSPPLGLGWRVDEDPKGRRRWHHAGNQEGGRASLVVYPDLGLSIALATNVVSTPGDTLTPSANLADVFTHAE